MTTINQYVVPKEYAKIIFNLAPLSLLSGCFALYMGHYSISIVPFSVGSTTLLYWMEPTYSWRRNLDMTVVITSCLYQGYRSLYAEYTFYYYIFIILGILSYIIGKYYHAKNNMYKSVLWHSGIHIFANIGNIILYSGYIKS